MKNYSKNVKDMYMPEAKQRNHSVAAERVNTEIDMGGIAALKHQISQQADYESESKPISLKRRSGTADNRAFDLGNGEKRLKVQKSGRAADTYDKKRPPKFGGK